MVTLQLHLLEGSLAICRLAPDAPIADWMAGPFFSLTRTPDETSVLCSETSIPPSVRCEPGWRALQIQGPFPFDAVGILAAVLEPLRRAHLPILAISTFDTDYVMVRQPMLEQAIEVLEAAGHEILREP